jgi:uncharacterized protein YacL
VASLLSSLSIIAAMAGLGAFFAPGRAGWIAGLGAGVFIVFLEALVGRRPTGNVTGGALGLLAGLLAAALASSALPNTGSEWALARVAAVIGLGWLGASLGARGRFGLLSSGVFRPSPFAEGPPPEAAIPVSASASDAQGREPPKILDTSVIIDGRIAEIADTGFISGPFVVPQFVLRELQQVADSSEPLKRNRGRRGLDVLQRLQKGPVGVEIVDRDFPEIREVDLKLIELSIHMRGRIVTNDFNLNKVAQVRGVKILNVNDLSNCLRPIVLPGEPMQIFVSKEGKEAGQGVGYLDDGTMVVVEGGRKALGRTIDVTVTTVLQTAAGKMIFVRWPEAPADDLSRKDTKPVLRRATDRVEGPTRGSGEILPRGPSALPPAAGEHGS